MNTFLGLLAATALIVLVALPSLIVFRAELRVSRQIRAARAAERLQEERSATARGAAAPTRHSFSPVV